MAPRKYNKKFNIMLNVFIPFLAILILLQAFVFLINGVFTEGGERSLEISADVSTTIQDKPVYDIFENIDENDKKTPIDEIKTKADFVTVYNNYINGLIAKGNFTFYNYGLTSGSGTLAGKSGTAYYVYEQTMTVSEDGSITILFAAAEIPDATGKFLKEEPNKFILSIIKNGTRTDKINYSPTYSVENGKYILHYDKENFVEETSEAIEQDFLFDFTITEDTIDSIKIDKKAFSYIIDVSLNRSGYIYSYNRTKRDSQAVGDINYEYFNLSFTVNNYGEITSFTRSEKCSLKPGRAPVLIITLVKNCYYKLEKE